MPLYSSSVLVPRNNWKSFDGNPCGVVKTGAGKAGIGEGTDFAGTTGRATRLIVSGS